MANNDAIKIAPISGKKFTIKMEHPVYYIMHRMMNVCSEMKSICESFHVLEEKSENIFSYD